MNKILKELKHHVPFTALATALAVILVFILYMNKINLMHFGSAFDIFHPAHVFVSAVVTSAIFYKYKKSVLLSLIIGLTGSIVIGSLSDIMLPYLGIIVTNVKISFHLPLIEEPAVIILTALIGSFAGTIKKIISKTQLLHFVHVLLSVFASLFYILAFAGIISPLLFTAVFAIVFIAVIVPCCISDIIYPLFFINSHQNN